MLANQIRPTTLSSAIVFKVHPFLAKKHRELPFLAITLFFHLFPPCSADHERDWLLPRKVVFLELATNALNVRNNNRPNVTTIGEPV